MQKDMVSSDFGKELRFIGEVMLTGAKIGADREFWSKLQEDRYLFRRVYDFVMNGGHSLPDRFKVKVDYSLTIKELVERGDYRYSSNTFDKWIPSESIQVDHQGVEEVEIELIQLESLKWDFYAENVLEKLPTLGCRAATPYELLSLGWQHPALHLGRTIGIPCKLKGEIGFLILSKEKYTDGTIERRCVFLPTDLGPTTWIATVRL